MLERSPAKGGFHPLLAHKLPLYVLFLKGYFWFAGKEFPKTIHTFHLDIVRLPVYNCADGVWRKDV